MYGKLHYLRRCPFKSSFKIISGFRFLSNVIWLWHILKPVQKYLSLKTRNGNQLNGFCNDDTSTLESYLQTDHNSLANLALITFSTNFGVRDACLRSILKSTSGVLFRANIVIINPRSGLATSSREIILYTKFDVHELLITLIDHKAQWWHT